MIGRGNSALSAMLVLEGRLADPSTASNGSFAIGGSVTGLYPGGLKWLGLTIANPQTFTIVVTSITTVVKATRASCPAGYLSIGSFAGHHWVAARGASHVAVPAKMAATAPNACNGARFTLTYRGLATKANQ